MLRSILFFLLRLVLGGIYIVSGYVKLYPIEPFELNFIDVGVANWITAPFIARLLIALELAIGLALVCNFEVKRIISKSSIILLAFFTIYLSIGLLKDGNIGNCGCFGTYLAMTPLESIYKNVGLIILSLVLLKFNTDFKWHFKPLIWAILSLIALATPFILNPPDLFVAENNLPQQTGYKLPLELLSDKKEDNRELAAKLAKGTHVVAFFSLTCPHCKTAAFKLQLIQKLHPDWSIQYILSGNPKGLSSFLDQTKSHDMNYILYRSEKFVKLSGAEVPIIMILNNGMVTAKPLLLNLTDKTIEPYIKNTPPSIVK